MVSLTPSWMTEDNIKLMISLWEQGATAEEIAHRISARGYKVTRNAVIGKAHRLNLLHNVVNKPEKARQVPKRRAAPKSVPKKILKLPIGQRKHAYKRLIKEKNGHRNGGEIMKKPDPTKQILLTETEEGHCRAIVGYRNNELAKAICCGEDAIAIIQHGKITKSPWCAYHHEKYTTEPRK